ncbi:MAG: aromatic amino acid ammonia-lyase [Actinomycetota bacterium]|nr:aromatic amino acid ammonia-lyase [Actinomycetota bacterium]MDQ2958368.1 aromatic amino acid ammonia-lyase [Actinomycetota bacterium]
MLRIDGHHLSSADIAAAAAGPLTVEVTEEARQRVSRSHAQAVLAGQRRPIYGLTTGVGANRMVEVEPETASAQALLRSHATSAGPARSADRVRAMLLIRLNQLCTAGSGVRLEVVQALADMINSDALPTIREFVGIGTAELSALASTALAMQARSLLPTASGAELVLGPHDALPFISSNAAALSDAGLAAHCFQTSARAALAIAALSFAAVRGNAEAYAPAVELATPMPGARATCKAMRGLVGSPKPDRIQDPYGLRALPQAHGILLDALSTLRATIEAFANAPSENPSILIDGSVAHHGGFHAGYLALTSDTAAIAAIQSGQLSLNRLTYVSEPNHTGLEPFLGDGTPGASGVMVVEYVAAAALGDLRAAAAPASTQSTTLSRGIEDTASFASLAARQLLTAADRYELLVACELVAALRAVRISRPELTVLQGKAVALCAELSPVLDDRDLTGDIETAQRLIPALAELVDFA